MECEGKQKQQNKIILKFQTFDFTSKPSSIYLYFCFCLPAYQVSSFLFESTRKDKANTDIFPSKYCQDISNISNFLNKSNFFCKTNNFSSKRATYFQNYLI